MGSLINIFEQHKTKILLLVMAILTIIIAILGYILYIKSLGININIILPALIFWMASMIFLLSLNNDSRMAIFARSLFVYLLMMLSIYTSFESKLAVTKLKQCNEKTMAIENP